MKDLSVILDEWEALALRKLEVNPPGRRCDCTDCNFAREKVDLIKALRYAMKHWGHGVKADITAILNGEEKNTDLGKQ